MNYYLYEIRNNLNGKVYVGVHSTQNMNDGYMGSGKVIRTAIEKYGLGNFTKVILEQFDTSAAMYAREKEIVTKDFLGRTDVYNLRCGGTGGFDYLNDGSDEHIARTKRARAAVSSEGISKRQKVIAATFAAERRGMFSDEVHSSHELRKVGVYNPIVNEQARIKARSEQAIEKRKATFAKISHQTGNKNSQFDTMWITDGVSNKKIKRTDVLPELWVRGRTKNK
jgi:hypothetical protein